jgi:hypothetical protein
VLLVVGLTSITVLLHGEIGRKLGHCMDPTYLGAKVRQNLVIYRSGPIAVSHPYTAPARRSVF